MPDANPISGPYSYTAKTFHPQPVTTVVTQFNSPYTFEKSFGLTIYDTGGVEITGSNGSMFSGVYLKATAGTAPDFFNFSVSRINITSGSSGVVIVSHEKNI